MSRDPLPSLPADESSSLEEQLVSYLDGELNAEDSRRIEAQLAGEPAVRDKLVELQRTWDLLGELEPAAAAADFTRSTLEMVTVAAAEEKSETQLAIPRMRRRRWVLAISTALLAGAAGFLAVVVFWPQPERQLLRDLPVVENLDQYRHVGDLDFLRHLAQQHWFDQERVAEEGKP